MLKIPGKIRIGSIDYNVELTEETLVCDGVEVKGWIDYDNSLIKINKSIQSIQSLEQTFLHEVVHGIVHDRGLVFDEKEEKIVDEIAKGIHQLIRDNKNLLLD